MSNKRFKLFASMLASAPALNDEEAYKALGHEIMVDEFGPRCAAWLVWSQKKAFRTKGVIRLVVPLESIDKLKPWFYIALAYLKRRVGKWLVEETDEGDYDGDVRTVSRVWYVTWKPKQAHA